jgi:hypothetical protein
VPEEQYTYTAQGPPVGYLRHRDTTTGSLLTGTLGHTCAIAALEEGLPVPPDARWAPAGSDAALAAAAAAAEAGRIDAAADAAAGAGQAPKGKGKAAKGDTGAPAGTEGTPGGES